MARLVQMIAATAARYRDKAVFIDYSFPGVKEVTFGGIWSGACRLAEKLALTEFPTGSIVVLSGANSPEWASACLGIHLAGQTVSPIDPEISDEELGNILSILEPAAAVCDNKLSARFKNSVPLVIELESLDLSPAEISFEAKPFREDQPVSIIFTSGSTSTPKGVMLSEKNFLHNVETLVSTRGLISAADRMLNLLPLHHVYPFTATLLTPLCVGATVIYPRSFKGSDIMEAARQQRATIIVVVPRVLQAMHDRIFSTVKKENFFKQAVFRLLLKLGSLGIEKGFRPGRFLIRKVHLNLPTLRFFACGGAKLDSLIHRDLATLGFRILEAYGLSETAPIATINSLRKPVFGSVGKPAPGVEIKFEQTDPALDEKEVLVRGPNVMLGYWRLPEVSEQAFLEGWFRTGDLGYLDGKGNLYLRGRSKEMIVLPSGKNIYPEELEKVYSRGSLVEEICICLRPDRKGEHLAAVVVPDREEIQRRKISRIYEEIKFEIENLSVRLPSYQRINEILLFKDPLPRTRLGKLKRYAIMETLEAKSKEAASATQTFGQEQEPQDELLVFVKQKLLLDRNVTGRENLELDLGLDSIAKLDFLSDFETRFGAALTDEQASAVLSVDDFRPFLKAAKAGATQEEGLRKRRILTPLAELVDLKEGAWGRLLRLVFRFKFKLIFRLLFGARITGIENLPCEGAYIIAPNHVSYIDALLIHALVPRSVSKRLFSLAIAGIFNRFPFAQISYRARVIKTGTVETTAKSLHYAEQILKLGYPLILFPEGKRSIDGKVDEPKPGAALLALKCRVPLVPVHLRGMEKILSRMHPGISLGTLEAEILPPIPPEGTEEKILGRWLKTIRESEMRHAT